MKKIFFITMILLLAQMVFAQDYNRQFAEKFAANDIAGIEKLLKEHSRQMDLQICLNSVSHSLAWLTMGENPLDFMEKGLMEKALPLNRNRNNILKTIQLLVNSGVDLNQYKYEGHYTSNVDGNLSFYRKSYIFSNILYWSIIGNSQPNMAIIKFLLESGAIPNLGIYDYDKDEILLLFAIGQGNANLVKMLVDAGCKIDQTYFFNIFDDESNIKKFRRVPQEKYSIGNLSALQYATYLGEYTIVKTLVESGAKISYVDKEISSYLNLASKTAADIAKERKETDIYNYLQSKQIASAPQSSSQVSSAPPPSSQSAQPRQTYNDSYDYSPPSSTPTRTQAPSTQTAIQLRMGTYTDRSVTGSELNLFTNTNSATHRIKDITATSTGNISISGDQLIITWNKGPLSGRRSVYHIDSENQFSATGETWRMGTTQSTSPYPSSPTQSAPAPAAPRKTTYTVSVWYLENGNRKFFPEVVSATSKSEAEREAERQWKSKNAWNNKLTFLEAVCN